MSNRKKEKSVANVSNDVNRREKRILVISSMIGGKKPWVSRNAAEQIGEINYKTGEILTI